MCIFMVSFFTDCVQICRRSTELRSFRPSSRRATPIPLTSAIGCPQNMLIPCMELCRSDKVLTTNLESVLHCKNAISVADIDYEVSDNATSSVRCTCCVSSLSHKSATKRLLKTSYMLLAARYILARDSALHAHVGPRYDRCWYGSRIHVSTSVPRRYSSARAYNALCNCRRLIECAIVSTVKYATQRFSTSAATLMMVMT